MADQDIPRAVRQMQNRLLTKACLVIASLISLVVAALLVSVPLALATLAIALYLISREIK